MSKNKGKIESKLTFMLEDIFNDKSSSSYCSINEQDFQKNF